MYSERDTLFATYYFLLFLTHDDEPGKLSLIDKYYNKFLDKSGLTGEMEVGLTFSSKSQFG